MHCLRSDPATWEGVPPARPRAGQGWLYGAIPQDCCPDYKCCRQNAQHTHPCLNVQISILPKPQKHTSQERVVGPLYRQINLSTATLEWTELERPGPVLAVPHCPSVYRGFDKTFIPFKNHN